MADFYNHSDEALILVKIASNLHLVGEGEVLEAGKVFNAEIPEL